MADREDIDEQVKLRFGGSEIGAFDDFLSRTFDTVLVSMCKTKKVAKPGSILSNPLVVEFLLTRSTKRLVIFANSKSLNAQWRKEFYDKSKE